MSDLAIDQQNALLDTLPASILLDIARNPSASQEWRKAATKLLRKKGYPQVQHAELQWLVYEIEKEERAEQEVIAVVEAATEQELVLDSDPSATEVKNHYCPTCGEGHFHE